MTSVIPAWKQELIEKKRKKEQEEKAKIQVQNDQLASLPEWKRILLAKKKGVQPQGVDTNNYGLGNNSTVSGYDRLGQNRSSFTSSTEREYETDLGKNAPKVIIIPKGNSQKGIQGGVKQHSFVASSVTDSDQQKKNKHIDEQLSTNGHKNFNKRETVSRFDEADGKVSYEHIKTPSELRKLFGVVSRDSVSFGSSSSDAKKIQNQQTQSNKVISTKPYRSGSPTDYEQSHKATQNTSREISSRKVEIFSHEHDLPKSPTPATSEVQKENSAIIVPEDNNDAEISAHSEHDSESKGLIIVDEIPPEVHVNVIRTKFGPSGNFRLHKSSSSDDLLKSKHQPLSPRDKDRPPPLNKRWSADVGGILSPTKSTSDEEDMFDSDHHKKRMRSKSMGDVRVDNFHESESVVDLRHRASISSGIERRLQELLHKLSVPDHDKNDDDDEDKDILDQDINDHFPDNFKSSSNTASSCEKQIDDEPRIRKTLWFNPEDESKLISTLHSNKADASKDKPLTSADMTTRSSVSSSARRQPSTTSDEYKSSNTIYIEKKEKANSHNISGDKPIINQKMKPFDSGRDVVIVAKEGKQIEEEEYSNDQELFAVGKPVTQKTIIMNGKISQEPIYDDSEMDQKPARGSVHKLSALFGSSILKGNKKAKSKSAQEQQLNQENSSKKEKKDSQKSNSSKIFPWSKKKKPEPIINEVTGEQAHHDSGVSSLKPVQKEVIEQKITGNMTLVINSNAGSYDSKSKQKQPLSNTHFNSNIKVPDNNRTGINSFNSITDQNSQVGVTSSRNKAPPALHKPEDTMVTVIDVPDINSSNDVEVSAIDLPEPPSPTPVSVIDMPESPEHDIKVSVIDIPDDDADSDDSDSSGSGMSGSYDINPVNGSDNFVATTTISEEDEEEEDIDNVPVSYVGDSTYMVVPEVIFESKVEDVKSCLSSPLRSRKRKAKVAFNPSNLVEVHDYPSEECMQYHYDQYAKENGGKTIDQYKPSCVQSLEETLKSRQTKEKVTENIRVTDNKKDFKSSQSSEFKHEKDSAPTIMYLDEGEGFTSSSTSGALLF